MVVLVHIFRWFQRIGQPEQIVLLRQLAGAETPEVIQLAGQLRADAQQAPLLQKPFNIGCNIARKSVLLRKPIYLPGT